jgi:hypothetical protein
MPNLVGKAMRQRETLEKIVKEYEAAPAQGNSVAEMIERTEYLLAKRMLSDDGYQRGKVDAKANE